jgi:hypothetical protein
VVIITQYQYRTSRQCVKSLVFPVTYLTKIQHIPSVDFLLNCVVRLSSVTFTACDGYCYLKQALTVLQLIVNVTYSHSV